MRSPFPGMDPYLEAAEHWTNVHSRLIGEISDRLTEQLRPRYFVGMEERAYITSNTDPAWKTIIPDSHVVMTRYPGDATPLRSPVASLGEFGESAPEGSDGGVAMAIEPIRLRFTTLRMREPYLEIIDTSNRKIVTIIEVLSPTNKVAGSRGRQKYKWKRERVMRSMTSLVEIDLLRGGRPFFSDDLRGACDYTVHVSRAEECHEGSDLWRIKLPQPLPSIPIPLSEGDADATLDLNATWHAIYDKAGFDLVLNYKADPSTPFTSAQAAWADRLLKAKGWR